MKKYLKPTVYVVSVMSTADISSLFDGFESFGEFSNANVESYLANSDNLASFKKITA